MLKNYSQNSLTVQGGKYMFVNLDQIVEELRQSKFAHISSEKNQYKSA